MNCVVCNSEEIKLNGKYKDYQNYKCRNCHRQFSERSLSFFCRHRFPEEVITNSVLQSFFVSTRNVSFIIKETMGFYFTNMTAYNWAKKFAQYFTKNIKKQNFSNIWHVDEKFVRVKGSRGDFDYMWVVIDDKNSIIAVYVSDSRNSKSAEKVLELAKKRAFKPPDIIVTDGLPGYIQACWKVFGRKTKHVQAHFEAKKFMYKKKYYILSNNRIESLNSKINLWYKKFRGFKSLATANLWARLWMEFYNWIRPRTIEHQTISIHQIIR